MLVQKTGKFDKLLNTDYIYQVGDQINYFVKLWVLQRRQLHQILTLKYTANVLSAEIADECLQTKSKGNLQ